MICGTVASKGYAYGQAFILRDQTMKVAPRFISDSEVASQLSSFRDARNVVLAELKSISEKAAHFIKEDEQQIFSCYVEILDDPELVATIEEKIRHFQQAADYAVYQTFEDQAQAISRHKNAYLRERASDLRDLQQRLLRALHQGAPLQKLPRGQNLILVAEDLGPAQSIQLDLQHVQGLIMDQGGETSHTSILARSLGIPAIVGTRNATDQIKDLDWLLLDAVNNRIIVHPTAEDLALFARHQEGERLKRDKYARVRNQPTRTADGHRIILAANIGRPEELSHAVQKGAEAIGLFRTEFLFMDRPTMPDDAEQYAVYRDFAKSLEGRSAIIRTMDIGGDKPLPYLRLPKEDNPFLGVRGIRVGLRYPQLLITQLRALLRAAVHGDIKIMFPMVSSVEEVIAIRGLLNEAKASLRAEQIPAREDVDVGLMIETPAAVAIADHLIRYVQFFSVGTNDLTQYTLAVDRGHADLAAQYEPLSPAVLRFIQQTVRAAVLAGKWAGVCGELAGHPGAALLLVGLGVTELSMSAQGLEQTRYLLSQVRYDELSDLAHRVLSCETAAEVKHQIDGFLSELDDAL